MNNHYLLWAIYRFLCAFLANLDIGIIKSAKLDGIFILLRRYIEILCIFALKVIVFSAVRPVYSMD